MAQSNFSAIPGSRLRLACERALRLGALAPRIAERGPLCKKRIGHIIQPDGVAELREEQAHHVAPRRKRSRLLFDPRLPRQSWHKVVRNQVANLAQHGQIGCGWSRPAFLGFFHTCRVAAKSTDFNPFFAILWDACDFCPSCFFVSSLPRKGHSS